MMKSILTTIAVTAVCGMVACAPARSIRSESQSDLALIQSQLDASNEKMEQLSQQIALLQMMVDGHQRTLQSLEDAGTQPLPAVSDEKATSAVEPQEPAPPVNEETHAVERIEPAVPEIQQTPVPSELSSEPSPESVSRLPIIDVSNPQYVEAMEMFRSGDYESAASRFEAFTAEFPEDDLADNALYWAGECKYAKKKFTEAVNLFKRVVEEYPAGSKVPDALLKIGFAYISLDDMESAETYLKQVASQHPFSTAGAKAEERLKVMQQ